MPSPESFEKYSKDEAQEEGENLKEKVEQGEASSYEEAEEELGKEMFEREGHPFFMKEKARLLVDYGSRSTDIDKAIASVPFEEALEQIDKYLDKFERAISDKAESAEETESREKPVSEYVEEEKRNLANSFVDLHLSSDTLDKFLSSSLEEHADPRKVISAIAEDEPNEGVMNKLLDRYEGEINWSELDLFGDQGVIEGAEEDVQRDYFESAFQHLITKMENEIERRNNSSRRGYGLRDTGTLGRVMDDVEAILDKDIIPSNSREILTELGFTIRNLDSSLFSDQVLRDYAERLGEIEARIEKSTDTLPQDVEGSGLEFVQSEYQNTTKAYLDGEFISNLVGAEFSDNPTNGEVVAWKVSETLGRDRVKGVQTSDKIYVWKKGWDEPERVYEDHAWSNERKEKVSPPEVDEDGTVSVAVNDETKEFSV